MRFRKSAVVGVGAFEHKPAVGDEARSDLRAAFAVRSQQTGRGQAQLRYNLHHADAVVIDQARGRRK